MQSQDLKKKFKGKRNISNLAPTLRKLEVLLDKIGSLRTLIHKIIPYLRNLHQTRKIMEKKRKMMKQLKFSK